MVGVAGVLERSSGEVVGIELLRRRSARGHRVTAAQNDEGGGGKAWSSSAPRRCSSTSRSSVPRSGMQLLAPMGVDDDDCGRPDASRS